MESGLVTNNTRRFIDVTNITEELGNDLDMTLPGFHAFTRLDFTAAFARQEKIKPFRIMCNSTAHMKFFASVGEEVEPTRELFTGAEQYVCSLYGQSVCTSVTQARYSLFKIECAPRLERQPLQKIQCIDATLLPPSRAAICEKLKRSNAVALIWKKANQQSPYHGIDPVKHGWY